MKISPVQVYNFNFSQNQRTAVLPVKNNSFDTVSFQSKNKKVKNEPAMITIEKIKAQGGNIPQPVEQIAQILSEHEDAKDIPLLVVHKIAYDNLKDYQTLSQVRATFPEFHDVKSPDDFSELNKGDKILQVKEKKVIGLNCTEDPALQYLKLYYSDLIPLDYLPHLSSTNKQSLFSPAVLLKRLNIPLMDPLYANVILAQKYNNELPPRVFADRFKDFI